MKPANNHSSSSTKEYFIPVPDNRDSFCAFINLVINNRNNAFIPNGFVQRLPSKIGPYKVTYTHNEVNELFIEVNELKAKVFIEMIVDQFTLLRSHWNMINSLEEYPSSDRY